MALAASGRKLGHGRKPPRRIRLVCSGVRALAAAALIWPLPSSAAPEAMPAADVALPALIIAGIALGLAGALWAYAESRASGSLRRNLRETRARARALIAARDAIIASGRESALVLSPNLPEPVSFGDAAQRLESCLTGPDAALLSTHLDALSHEGAPFALGVRGHDGEAIAVRGQATGGMAVLFLALETATAPVPIHLKSVLDALPIPVWLRRNDLALSFVNRAFVAASGAPTADAALAGEIALDRSERELAATARADRETVEAKRFAVLGGHRRALAFTLAPLPGGGVAGSALDITALSDAEARLKQHIEAHTDTLDRLATAVSIFGSDRRLLFCNRAYLRLWALDESWLSTHPTEGEILDRLREMRRLPEQPDFRAWKEQRLKLFEKADQHPEELWHLPGGRTLRVVAQPHPFGGLSFLYEDVSDHLRLESSYNTLIKVQKATLDTLQEGVAVFGPDGRLKLHNAAFARIWRLEEADLAGEPHVKRIAESCARRFGQDRAWEIVLASATAAAPERRREWGEVERSDSAIISLTIAPLPDGATLASFVDVTDRFRIESALRDRNDALEASDRLKSEFVKRISYELRTPLNTILGFAELLKDAARGPLNARQDEYVSAILQASNGLRDLINDILDLSEIESGSMTLELQGIELYPLLESMAEHVRDWAMKLRLNLKVECDRNAGTFVGDSRRLRQVIFNMLSNAFKYTPERGTVILGGEIKGEEVCMFVADTGSGIAPDIMPSAFERFSAKGGAVARAGAGLGLALVNRFVELHHGWVELESEMGEGTRVTCHLPRHPRDDEAIALERPASA
jgi:signal transduction histidine kinase